MNKMLMRLRRVSPAWVGLAVLPLILTGCATPMSSNVYSSNTAMQMQTVRYGTIQSLRGVEIAANNNDMPIGALGGAVIGGLLGSGVGGGLGRSLATAGGAIAGGIAGNAIQDNVGRQNGVEVVVRLDDGRTVSVVQPVGQELFRVGQRVQLMTAPNGTTRVTGA